VTIRDILDRNLGLGPGFHFFRHLLSILIVLWHVRQAIWWSSSAAALTAANEIATGLARSSVWSIEDMIRPIVPALVGSFFALSGFLVAGSALRIQETGRFLLNRALRIFPALSVETLLSAFILGPVFTSLTLWQYLTNPEFYRYFGNMVGWVYYFLPGVFENNPLPRVINGQLWTLPPEFWCYFLMAFALTTRLIMKRRVLLALAAVSMVGMLTLYAYDPVTFAPNGENFYRPWYIIVLFWLGVITFLYAEKIPISMPLFALSALLYWCIIFFNVLPPPFRHSTDVLHGVHWNVLIQIVGQSCKIRFFVRHLLVPLPYNPSIDCKQFGMTVETEPSLTAPYRLPLCIAHICSCSFSILAFCRAPRTSSSKNLRQNAHCSDGH